MKTLLGVGGSDDSLEALEKTVDRAAETGDDLTIAVVENPETDRDPEAVGERAREVLAAAGVDAEVRQVTGDPGSRLVEIAERDGFDRIVLGGGHRSPMGKIKIGGIAEFVLLNSRITVTLVR